MQNKQTPFDQRYKLANGVRLALYVLCGHSDLDGPSYDQEQACKSLIERLIVSMRKKAGEAQADNFAQLCKILKPHLEVVELDQVKDRYIKFAPYAKLPATSIEQIKSTATAIKISITELLDPQLLGLQIMQFLAAHLAMDSKGTILEPDSLKAYRYDNEILERFESIQPKAPSLNPFIMLVQGRSQNHPDRVTTNTVGLSRFQLPEIEMGDLTDDEHRLSYLMGGMAQSLIETACKTQNDEHRSIDFSTTPLAVSTDQVILANLKDPPHISPITKTAKIPMRLVYKHGVPILEPDWPQEGERVERDAQLQKILSILGLIEEYPDILRTSHD